jgi:hypothetical protein
MKLTRMRTERRGESARRLRAALALTVSAAALLCAASKSARAQEPFVGEWAIEFGRGSDDVRLTLYSHSGVSGNGSSSLILPSSKLQGLSAGRPSAERTRVVFSLTREAGTFAFEGYVEGGRGAGRWRLTPDPNFVAEMRRLGYDNFYDHQLLVAAIYDLNKGYVAGLRDAGYERVPLVKEVRSLGVRGLSLDKLISMRMFSITPAFVRELAAQGYEHLSADELIGVRMNNVTPEFIAGLREQGYDDVSLNDLLRMRMFQVDGAFIARLRRQGFEDLTVDQLVGLRFKNVGM